ncbi:MAG TPA: PIG-L family deacetylase [Glutamicibacter sp.]|uniref:LmbE-like protein n=2 Tax=Glutamicibacter arilaitensis TaxID=256701 RepID=A0ABP1U7T3_GLUAR|nr:PIG-L deacetylase family protein [Glutamicibacter sp.]CBT77427.1 LmbE-like protein [Glutamicibacter arilaitensis Re117]HCH46629.1 PIG-L family deacetylase [Glutamicibacter sp.]
MSMTLAIFGIVASITAVFSALSRRGRRWLVRDFTHYKTIIIAWITGNLVLIAAACLHLLSQEQSEIGAVVAIMMAISLLIFCLTMLALQRRPQNNTRPRRFLAVGAHPDDVELACGATIAKLVDAGHDVRIVVMSQGESGGHAPRRIQEARRGAGYLGAQSHTVWSFCDTRLSENSNLMVAAIEEEIAAFEPDVVLTHSATDIHQDHEAVHRAVMRAGRRLPSILCFESPSVGNDFSPSFFVDVENYTNVKVEAIKLHADQRNKPYMTRARIESMANFRGNQVKQQRAEGFEVMRLVSTTVGDF